MGTVRNNFNLFQVACVYVRTSYIIFVYVIVSVQVKGICMILIAKAPAG